MTTELEMRTAIEARLRQQPHHRELKDKVSCCSPLRSDKNPSFTYYRDGGYIDGGAGGTSGSAYDLAEKLGIPTPDKGNNDNPISTVDLDRVPAQDEFRSLQEYAEYQGVDKEVFARAGWSEGMRKDRYGVERLAFVFKTHRGEEERYRFASGSQKYGHRKDYPLTLYGLTRAIAMVRNAGREIDGLILCNGEASTVVAQHYGLPAFCKTSGEASLPANLLAELKGQWNGKIYIAFDCDDAGRTAAKKVQAQWENSVIIDLGLHNKGDLANFCKLHKDSAAKEFNKLIDHSDGLRGVRSDVAMREYISFIYENDPKPQAGIPLRWPFVSFHKYKGMFQICDTGKIISVVGGSGDGKTAFTESLVDRILMNGGDVFWYGEEWKPSEMAARRVARYGGIDLTEVANYKYWLQEWARGVPIDKRQGIKPDDSKLVKSAEIAAQCARWPGRSVHIPNQRFIENILSDMTHNLSKMRSEGRPVMLAVFDYVQLLRCQTTYRDGTTNRYEAVLEEIKNWVEINDMVAIVVSQVTKSAQGEARNAKIIKKEDAQWVRSDKFNGMITLNFDYVEVDGEDIRVEDSGFVIIQKNSAGAPTGRVKMISKLERYGWFDPLDSSG